MGWKVEDEWVEYEHFYRHPCYQRDQVYLVGAAGSFTCEFMGLSFLPALCTLLAGDKGVGKKLQESPINKVPGGYEGVREGEERGSSIFT